MQGEERLIAYVDGELCEAEAAAFETELASDPELQRRVEQQRRLRSRLAAVFDPVLDEETPLRLKLAAEAANAPSRAWRAPQWAAMAACLALGVLVGRAALPPRGPFVATPGGALVARGPMAKALDAQLAADGGAVRVGISFRAADGRYCRSFENGPERLAGVACKAAEGWRAETLSATRPSAGSDYRTAGSETPAPVLAAVDALIAGEPLDAAAERAARDHGWTSR